MRHRVAAIAEMQRRGRRDGHLRNRPGMRGDELEMLDHGMGTVGAELAHHAQHHRLGLRPLELDLALAEIGLDAIELTEEIVVPEGAAELAVGDRREAGLFLPADDFLDLAVLDRFELLGAELAALALRACLLEGGRAQQASDMIGAKRRLGARHERADVTPPPRVPLPSFAERNRNGPRRTARTSSPRWAPGPAASRRSPRSAAP